MATETSLLHSNWTFADIPDLQGKTIICTGANSGIGFWFSLKVAVAGADVVMACRDYRKAEAARSEILKSAPKARIEIEVCDLSSFTSVRAFAEKFIQSHSRLDVLLCNAGQLTQSREVTQDRNESVWQVNHLANFLLVGLLLPLLRNTPRSRVVNVSSNLHRSIQRIEFDDIDGQKKWSTMHSYSQSKLMNLLFTCELNRQFESQGLSVIAVTCHPGFSTTSLFRTNCCVRGFLACCVFPCFAQSAEAGSMPLLRAATAPDVVAGDYFGPKSKYKGPPVRETPAPQGMDEEAARRLWRISEERTQFTYTWN